MVRGTQPSSIEPSRSTSVSIMTGENHSLGITEKHLMLRETIFTLVFVSIKLSDFFVFLDIS
jgi:hypothetical protein